MQNIVVCVTLQSTCERLINAAETIRKPEDALFVLHVTGNGQAFLGGKDDGKTLEYLYEVAQKARADRTVQHVDDIAGAMEAFVRKHDINVMILGTPPQGESELIRRLRADLAGVCRVLTVDKEKGVFL